jgi:hypothetical protein
METAMTFKPLLAPAFAAYWFLFWLLNGLDKFFYGVSFDIFTWHGKDRHEQFVRYFENMGMEDAPIDGLLYFAGAIELAVAIPFLICGPMLLSRSTVVWEKGARIMHIGLAGSFAIFLGFISMDVISGDRAELLEHSIYLAVIAASYGVPYLEYLLRQTNGIDGPTGRVQHI